MISTSLLRIRLSSAASLLHLAWFDRHVIDQFMNFMAWGTNAAGETVQPIQSGKVQTYTHYFLAGIIVLTIILLLN